MKEGEEEWERRRATHLRLAMLAKAGLDREPTWFLESAQLVQSHAQAALNSLSSTPVDIACAADSLTMLVKEAKALVMFAETGQRAKEEGY